MKIFQLPIIVTFDVDTYIAKCPSIQGAFAEGDSPEEAIKELIEVIQMIKVYRKQRGEYISNEAIMETNEMKVTLPIEV
jgi:predicted RNase H-like HicB family nuclease